MAKAARQTKATPAVRPREIGERMQRELDDAYAKVKDLEQSLAYYRARAVEVAPANEDPQACRACRAPMLLTPNDHRERVRELFASYRKLAKDADARDDFERGQLDGMAKALRVLCCCLACEAKGAAFT